MSRTFQPTSRKTMTLRGRPGQSCNAIKGKGPQCFRCEGYGHYGLNVLLISRNNRKVIISPGLMKKKKKKKMERKSIMLKLLLEDVNLIRIPMVMTLPMINCLIPMKKSALRERS